MHDPEPDAALASWLRLDQTPGLGPLTARRLLSAFGLPQHIFSATPPALLAHAPAQVVQALKAPPSDATQALVERTLEWASVPGNQVLTLADAAYPPALLNIPDPPLLLYVKGQAALLARHALAVVGSRNATLQGRAHAEAFSAALSAAGLTIISGLALGIDASAHQGGLRGIGSTVAVIGTGADKVYPARNHALAHRIAEEGCIISEYPLGTPPVPHNFPRRNRIISGLARGVLVIEAAAQSGSLITARMAADQGRDVFAIPGSIHSPLSKGCHLLIRQGAKLVDDAQDILDELNIVGGIAQRPCPPPSAQDASAVLDAMGHDPVHPDTLAQRCGFDMPFVQAELLALELDNRIETLPGGMVRRLAAT
ncbi:DNA-processing protein DprA [Noviherbaspirillum galbum]|uniref:DNA-protecting protein DprA n=1 Tax=Noviherbaspirillum galbum TaxID=2709383 RepID=A0A6B3SST1_9BURK|nr:DNA-processing protein DprA [Noviherbaspirillum galbum]NEX63823.1 DNA-protecting protein DprA [Noviherbaspirillum galbum]